MDFLPHRLALGEAVRERRSELGYSQEGFSMEVELHRTYIGAIERGERNVSLHNLLRIAWALGIELSELIADAEARTTRRRSRRRSKRK